MRTLKYYIDKCEQQRKHIAELDEQVLHGKSLEELQRVMRENDELAARLDRTCEWIPPDRWDDDCWSGECGTRWSFMADGPEENNMNYCPKCGGKVIIKILEQKDEV